MGRWTPLILMAGGVAILLGTLLGINFPMGGQQTANVPPGRRASSVLPANINVNSTATRDDAQAATRNNSQTANSNNSQTTNSNDFSDDTRSTSIAQSNATTESTGTTDSTQNTNTTDTSTSTSTSATDTNLSSGNSNQDKEPIRALW
ncbi:hypothetical protein [Anabaena sp. UHCC 0451]|uniref:hypothetical protein n=1 Tax=Anabaena sp. UHCC 0451 TaxID=2055235 RepID=UPI002B20822F|nr:hypothetical protein [Anabaena sp. UHCC 0451]MEA5577373.1 hypothetical protein [Anabaena sp. UHCC 0451]